MPVDYQSLEQTLALAKERANVGDEETTAPFPAWLEDTIGVNASGDVFYRPHYVAAVYLEQSAEDQGFSSMDVFKFTGMTKPIESLMRYQALLDAKLGLKTDFPALVPAKSMIFSTTSVPRRVY